ncbi:MULTISPECIES: hypothetical protein [unclassified Paenibacillus]|uniref:hypothetical protein n=1 Tax=unclassified Paenibacillus TaxID=185978 RepID=UPI003626F631
MNKASLGKITGILTETAKVRAVIEPSGQELGWLPSLIPPNESLVESECLVVPCHGSYGQGLVIPFPLPMGRTGTLQNISPLKVLSDGTVFECLSTVQIESDDLGKVVIIIPLSNALSHVLIGVIR